jgi:hypothetical protein
MKRIFVIALCLLFFGTVAHSLDVVIDKVRVGWQTDAERATYVGESGEVVFNVDTKGLTVYDGSTIGGFAVGLTVGSQPPASATASGQPGEIRAVGNYLYVCVAEDEWKRAMLLSW